MNEEKMAKTPRLPGKALAALPMLALLVIMLLNFFLEWGQDAHIPVMIAAAIAIVVGKICGWSYQDMLTGAVSTLSRSMEAILILFCIGTLIGAWIYSGTIASIVYYGLFAITPKLFLPIACIICAIVGISIGSSWTTVGSVGIAFMAIGESLGFSSELVAGMLISGAYCGDKLSPLSDTTNLAAASAQTGLFDHVRAMVSTTFPSFIIALIIYTVIGLGAADSYDPTLANGLQDAMKNHYAFMNPILILPVLVIIGACIFKVPAIPGIMLATVTGLALAMIFQGTSFVDCITAVHYGFEIDPAELTVSSSVTTDPAAVEEIQALAGELLNRGGMNSMLWTINLVIIAVAFGGILEKVGCVESLLGGLMRRARKPFGAVLVTLVTSAVCDWTMGDQYLAIVIPGQMYQKKFDELGLGRNMLSRSLEDLGTLWSPLCPWNSCGAFQSSTLGMSCFAYFPYAFMNMINPIYALVTSALGRNILYADGSKVGLLSGKIKPGTAPQAPEEGKAIALAALKAQRGE